MRLEGKTAIVTGGANGIGAGCVRRLAAEGANLVIADIDNASGQTLAAELSDASGGVIYVCSDITQRQAVEALFSASLAAFGAVDILVNNAAYVHKPGVITNFLDYSDEAWETTLAVNLVWYVLLLANSGSADGETRTRRGDHQCEQRWRFPRAPAHVRLRYQQGRYRSGHPLHGA